jgi:hypothetical protein
MKHETNWWIYRLYVFGFREKKHMLHLAQYQMITATDE